MFQKLHRMNMISISAAIFNPVTLIFSCIVNPNTQFTLTSLFVLSMIQCWKQPYKQLKLRHSDLQAVMSDNG